MSQTLAEVNASAEPKQRLLTLEITSDAFDPVLICNGFTDRTCVTEDSITLTFIAANMGVQLARRNNKGNQTMSFAVDNTMGDVSNRVDDSQEAQARVTAVFRQYLLATSGRLLRSLIGSPCCPAASRGLSPSCSSGTST